MDIDVDQLEMAIDTKRRLEQKLLSPEELPNITETWRGKLFLNDIEETIISAQEHGKSYATYRLSYKSKSNFNDLSLKEAKNLLKTIISPRMKKTGWSFSWYITFSDIVHISVMEINMSWKKPGFWRKFINYLTSNK